MQPFLSGILEFHEKFDGITEFCFTVGDYREKSQLTIIMYAVKSNRVSIHRTSTKTSQSVRREV